MNLRHICEMISSNLLSSSRSHTVLVSAAEVKSLIPTTIHNVRQVTLYETVFGGMVATPTDHTFETQIFHKTVECKI